MAPAAALSPRVDSRHHARRGTKARVRVRTHRASATRRPVRRSVQPRSRQKLPRRVHGGRSLRRLGETRARPRQLFQVGVRHGRRGTDRGARRVRPFDSVYGRRAVTGGIRTVGHAVARAARVRGGDCSRRNGSIRVDV